MFIRSRAIALSAATLSVAGLLGVLQAFEYLSDTVLLTNSEMSRSRGKNEGKQKGIFSCNDLSKLSCNQVGTLNCLRCSETSYTDSGTQAGSYIPGAAGGGNCGTKVVGDCMDLNGFYCFPNPSGVDTELPCTPPPGVPKTQPG
jgi:hypothetical protein